LEQFQFLADVHGHGQGLVAIAQIHAAPDWRVGEDAVWPPAVGKRHRWKRSIFGRWIFQHNRQQSLKAKTPLPIRQWGSQKIREQLEPDCRAGQQQRLRKQQVQIAIHAGNLASATRGVKRFRGGFAWRWEGSAAHDQEIIDYH
jgi:hypothetical protein